MAHLVTNSWRNCRQIAEGLERGDYEQHLERDYDRVISELNETMHPIRTYEEAEIHAFWMIRFYKIWQRTLRPTRWITHLDHQYESLGIIFIVRLCCIWGIHSIFVMRNLFRCLRLSFQGVFPLLFCYYPSMQHYQDFPLWTWALTLDDPHELGPLKFFLVQMNRVGEPLESLVPPLPWTISQHPSVLKCLLRYGLNPDSVRYFLDDLIELVCVCSEGNAPQIGFHSFDHIEPPAAIASGNVLLQVIKRVEYFRSWPWRAEADWKDMIHKAIELGVFPNFYRRDINQPANLLHLCQCSIRESLRKTHNLPEGIDRLPLPTYLKQYIDLKHD